MLRTYSLRRHAHFLALLVTLLIVAAHTARATDIRQLRAALTGGGGFAFSFRGGMGGNAMPETLLVIDSINDSGSFTGKYYPYTGTAPSADNVSGTITINNDSAGGAISVSFRVTTRVAGIVGEVDTYNGALRLGASDSRPSFMAGTYTVERTATGPRRAPGPYPFCATFMSIPG